MNSMGMHKGWFESNIILLFFYFFTLLFKKRKEEIINEVGAIALKRFFLYLIRWQLSTPILAVVVGYFAYMGEWVAAAIANLIGGTIFYNVDKFIFKK